MDLNFYLVEFNLFIFTKTMRLLFKQFSQGEINIT